MQGSSLTRERLTLLRQPLPQLPAAHKIIQDPADPARVAQYIRLNYFSSDATKQVMHVRHATFRCLRHIHSCMLSTTSEAHGVQRMSTRANLSKGCNVCEMLQIRFS